MTSKGIRCDTPNEHLGYVIYDRRSDRGSKLPKVDVYRYDTHVATFRYYLDARFFVNEYVKAFSEVTV